MDVAERGHEAWIVDRPVDRRGIAGDHRPPGGEPGRLRMPHAAADVDLARLEVEVAAGPARPASPRHTGSWRSRTACTATCPSRSACRGRSGTATAPDRAGADRASRQPIRERHAERLERLLHEALVVGLAGLEPGPVVVGGELRQEVDRRAAETRELRGRGRHRGHRSLHRRRSSQSPYARGLHCRFRGCSFVVGDPGRACRVRGRPSRPAVRPLRRSRPAPRGPARPAGSRPRRKAERSCGRAAFALYNAASTRANHCLVGLF